MYRNRFLGRNGVALTQTTGMIQRNVLRLIRVLPLPQLEVADQGAALFASVASIADESTAARRRNSALTLSIMLRTEAAR